jgi:uncharacterized membrane protein
MASAKQSILVGAPVEEVFAYVNDPHNLPEVWPNLEEIKDVEWLPGGGSRFTGVYRMAGVRLEIVSEDVEFVLNERVVNKTQGGIDSTLVLEFSPEEGGTRVTVEAEFQIPIPLVGRLAEEIVTKINEKDLVFFLNYLKLKFDREKA